MSARRSTAIALTNAQLKPAIVLAAFLAFSAPLAGAQSIRGADTLSARAAADSQAVLKDLAAAVRAQPKDAALRFRQGMIAWLLSVRDKAQPPIRGLDGPRLAALADSSLRLALQFEPKNARHELALGNFMRSSSDPVLRLNAVAHIETAVALARNGPDTAFVPLTVLELGRLHWLRYDSDANQLPYLQCWEVPQSLDSATILRPTPQSDSGIMYMPTEVALKLLHSALLGCLRPAAGAGNGEYDRAEALFREAYTLAPVNDDRAFRQLAMLLAEKNRWVELASVARDRIKRRPSDGWAWLDLGLALHRSGKSSVASATFDTAATRLPPPERARLFAFQRLLARPDSLKFTNSNANARTDYERSFWQMADPLWSREGNDPRTEFLARVAFAELRWTVDELGVRGADSDRGEVYIRYGPADRIAAIRGCNSFDCAMRDGLPPHIGFPKPPDPVQAKLPSLSDVVTYWDYDNGLVVVFWGAPTYGTARFPVLDGPHFERAIELRAAAFDNVAVEKILEMPFSSTRFRAPGDSVDLLLLAQAPVADIRAVTTNAPVHADIWLLGRNDVGDLRDSTQLSASGFARVVYRVAPEHYLARIEATAPGTMVAGRSVRWITADRDTATGFSLHGFGVSDILFATAAQPNKPAPVRWRDFNIAPLLGALPKQSKLDLIWENYDLGARAGQTQYAVAITLQRQRTASGRIAAAIIGLATNAVGVDRRDDRVTFKFDRSGPAAPPAFVDHVLIALNETPAGDYRVTLEITDKVSGRKAVSVTTLTIAK
jgi:GWxTD domain-containing protein